jgi:tRNA-(ms[2]io[6]A)-hydroxylase
MIQVKDANLPLIYRTPDAWAESALTDPLKLLNDHAHLEKKAAVNALELLNRWPQPQPPELWETTLTAVARDEVEHLGAVIKLMHRRGGRLSPHHRNPYANALRQLVRLGRGLDELVDRLLVSALIEARSCERFALLGRAADDLALAKLYRGLWASEHGHYRVFLQLAQAIRPAAQVESRWEQLLAEESRIIGEQTPGPRMHSGAE